MFESLQKSLQKVFSRLGKGGRLNEANVTEGLREIRTALLEADVNFKVAKELIKEVTDRAVGEKVVDEVRPDQQIVKIFQDVLTEKLGEKAPAIPFASGRPTVIMMAGLQGSGKTTTTAKLARQLQKKGRQPLLVAADVQRPAAIKQLQILGEQLGLPVYSDEGASPPAICEGAVAEAKKTGRDVVLLDTAGRLHIDEPLMKELEEVSKKSRPDVVYLVCDSMTGQDAVNSAKEFNDRLEITGVILTKLDGDTRGGAAISVYQVTKKPIAWVGIGEKVEELEEFHPDRMASRILGMGDVVSLVEKAQEVMDREEAETAVTKLLKDEFTFDDFLKQLAAVKKLGSMKSLLSHLPGGVGQQMEELDPEGKSLVRLEAIIQSMSRRERKRPDSIDAPRRRRIARGSGTTVADVNDLLKQFRHMRHMMKQLQGKGFFGRMASRVGIGKGPELPEDAMEAAAGGPAAARLRGSAGSSGVPVGMPAGFGADDFASGAGRPKASKDKRKQQKQARRRNRKRR